MNNGAGNFTKVNNNIPANIADLTNVYMSSRLADIDNDNDSDLILGALDGSGITKDLILLNNGSGQFTPGQPLPDRYGTSTWGTVSIVTQDFNNDGWKDLLMSTMNYQTCQLQLLLNNQNGTFTDATANLPQSWATSNTWVKWIETGDFNNDGNIDIVCAAHYAASPKLYYNNGNAQFTDASSTLNLPTVNGILSTRVRDYDNDGRPDIAFLASNNKIVIAKSIQDYVLNTNDFSINPAKGIAVYPNPFKNNFSFKLPEGESIKSLTIFDFLGKKVFSSNEFDENTSFNFLPKGIYILNLETNKKKYVEKIIKE